MLHGGVFTLLASVTSHLCIAMKVTQGYVDAVFSIAQAGSNLARWQW